MSSEKFSPTSFLTLPRQDLQKRSAGIRKSDFLEFTTVFGDEALKNQGRRCMDCGVPFCQGETGCPVHNFIPEWNTLVSEGDWKSALDRLHATNNFPEFTGKLCPAPCESACVLGIIADPVSIKGIEESIIDRGFQNGWVKPNKASRQTGQSVAIIGSGPAGLTAAQELARDGHSVTVFEKAEKVGGLLRFGIPDFKFEKSIIDRRILQMEAEGVKFQTGICIGKHISFETLRKNFDAVCIAIGAEQPRDLQVPGRNLQGVHFAMDYLTQQNRSIASGGSVVPSIHAAGKRVIILGGGDTGSDCLGTAIRQGAKSVVQVELLPMPQKLRSSHAHEEGGQREWGFLTTRLEGDGVNVTGLIGNRLSAGSSDPEDKVEIRLDADLVLIAMGFSGPKESSFMKASEIKTDLNGKVLVDQFNMTSAVGVFAAGDVHRGASLIVWAIAEGRKVARSISTYLESAKRSQKFNSNQEAQV